MKKKRGCLFWIGIGFVLFVVAIAFSALRGPSRATPQPAATATLSPTQTQTPMPTSTPAATATAPAPAPATLGSSLDAWRARYGQPTERFGYHVFGAWEILPLPGGQAQHIERTYDPAVAPAVALADAAALLPADAVLLRTYSPDGRPETIVDLYHSPTLAAQLPATAWVGGEPGEFVVLRNEFPEGVPRIVIASGNNP